MRTTSPSRVFAKPQASSAASAMPIGNSALTDSALCTAGELLQAVVTRLHRVRQDRANVREQSRIAPAVAGRVLGGTSVPGARGLEQDTRGNPVEFRVVAWRKMKVAGGAAPRVLVDEGS